MIDWNKDIKIRIKIFEDASNEEAKEAMDRLFWNVLLYTVLSVLIPIIFSFFNLFNTGARFFILIPTLILFCSYFFAMDYRKLDNLYIILILAVTAIYALLLGMRGIWNFWWMLIFYGVIAKIGIFFAPYRG